MTRPVPNAAGRTSSPVPAPGCSMVLNPSGPRYRSTLPPIHLRRLASERGPSSYVVACNTLYCIGSSLLTPQPQPQPLTLHYHDEQQQQQHCDCDIDEHTA